MTKMTAKLMLIVMAVAAAATVAAGADEAALDAKHRQRAQSLIEKGVAFLMSQRESDGGWSLGQGSMKPAITAMALKTLIRHPAHGPRSAAVGKGFDVLRTFRQADGGIYDPKMGMANYTTSLSVMAISAAGDPKHNDLLRGAVAFLRCQQIATGSRTPDGKAITKDHPFAGGVSYGRHGRPDLSNVGMWIQALHEAGVPAEDPAMQSALLFVTRTQNDPESNKCPWAVKGPGDGGHVYAPATAKDLNMGESKAGKAFGGGLRSYGSMTYVGFMSLLYAGVGPEDPRVRAAFRWIRKHWRLDSNPNMPQKQSRQGLYYYYHAFAKALRAWGHPVITDLKGVKHNWRHELIDKLAQLVRPDGSWVGDLRWNETSPVLVTCYAVLAMQEAIAK